MGPICCPETSENNYLPMLRKNPQIGDIILEHYLNVARTSLGSQQNVIIQGMNTVHS
jgi:hypothetical protein